MSLQCDRSSGSQCGASPDALKMHSQLCYEVHLDLAESKSIDMRAGQEAHLSNSQWSIRFKKKLFVLHPVAIACLNAVPCWDVP
jgi:hypothetical protein